MREQPLALPAWRTQGGRGRVGSGGSCVRPARQGCLPPLEARRRINIEGPGVGWPGGLGVPHLSNLTLPEQGPQRWGGPEILGSCERERPPRGIPQNNTFTPSTAPRAQRGQGAFPGPHRWDVAELGPESYVRPQSLLLLGWEAPQITAPLVQGHQQWEKGQVGGPQAGRPRGGCLSVLPRTQGPGCSLPGAPQGCICTEGSRGTSKLLTTHSEPGVPQGLLCAQQPSRPKSRHPGTWGHGDPTKHDMLALC